MLHGDVQTSGCIFLTHVTHDPSLEVTWYDTVWVRERCGERCGERCDERCNAHGS